MSDKKTDFKRIEQLIELMKKNDLVELEIKNDDEKILLKRAQAQVPQITAVPMMAPVIAPAAGPGAAVPAEADSGTAAASNLIEIKAPMVGTFYGTPSPDSDPYVEAGTPVTPSSVVCIIEAMKVMNEIKAETEGTVAEVCVKSGQAVEYGQVLFRVKPD